MTDKSKDFGEWRAEKLGYVYFSRLADLIIKELDEAEDPLFDYLIDIGERQKQTGRYFLVEVKAVDNATVNELIKKEYANIPMPALLILFDNRTDQGYYTWIQKPEQDGRLIFNDVKDEIEPLNTDALHRVVNQIKDWYAWRQSHRQVA